MLLNITAAAFVYRNLPGSLLQPLEPLEEIGSLSATSCRACHRQHYDEWFSSSHGRSFSKPLYQADLEHQGSPYFCNHCHAPLAEQQPRRMHGLLAVWPKMLQLHSANPRFDPALQEEGVTCVVCHQQENHLLGPTGSPSAPHAVKLSSELGSVASCAPCHQMDLGSLSNFERPLMDTVREWQEYQALGGEHTCVDCHLPKVGPRSVAPDAPARSRVSHRLLGPRDPEFLRTAIELRRFEVESTSAQQWRATVELYNATGHRIPTADPHRRLEVIFETVASDGTVLHQAVHRIERVIDLIALQEHSDNTLSPRQARAIELAVPADEGDDRARVRVQFLLWDPADPVAVAAGLNEADLVHFLYEDWRELP